MCGSGSWRFVYTAKILEVTREVFVVSLWNRVATDDVNTSSANAELDSCITSSSPFYLASGANANVC